jgi:UrcA family protein
MTRTSIFLAALAATAATVAFPAFAAETAPSTEVHYSDLNLASTAGADALKARVARAAKRVCTVDGEKSLSGAAEARKCAEVALAKAMPQVELALANAGTQVAENSRLSVAAH